jgi:hypothetical protein
MGTFNHFWHPQHTFVMNKTANAASLLQIFIANNIRNIASAGADYYVIITDYYW